MNPRCNACLRKGWFIRRTTGSGTVDVVAANDKQHKLPDAYEEGDHRTRKRPTARWKEKRREVK